MTFYNVIIRIPYFSVPYPLEINSSIQNFWCYPGDIVEVIDDLEKLILFNENNIENYKSFKVREFLEKGKNKYCYILFKLELVITESIEKLVAIIHEEIEHLIILFDYLLSNFHFFDKIYIFQLDNQIRRVIQLSLDHPLYIKRSTHLQFNLIKDLETFLSKLIQKIEKNSKYIDEFELFLRGKIYIEYDSFYFRKGRRNALDNLSDIWESIEHISKIYWKIHKKDFKKILQKDTKANHKVKRFIYMLEDLHINLDQDEENAIQEIYTDFYNIKKHETSDLEKIDLFSLGDKLRRILETLEKCFAKLFEIYPDIIDFRDFKNKYYMIVPVNEREDFSNKYNTIYKRRKLLDKDNIYNLLIEYIEYEPIYQKCLKYFPTNNRYSLRVKDFEREVIIRSIQKDTITFSIFEKLFRETYEFLLNFSNSSIILKVRPDKLISYPEEFKEKGMLSLRFPVKFYDLLFGDIRY